MERISSRAGLRPLDEIARPAPVSRMSQGEGDAMQHLEITVGTRDRPRWGLRILAAATIVGTLDLAYALGVNAAHGIPPEGVLRYIASGLLGTAAFQGGAAAVFLGVACHFGLMAIFALAVAVSVRRPGLRNLHPLLLGLVAGAALYLVMTFVVVPLSRTPDIPPLPPGRAVSEILVHLLLVGPLVAWIVVGRAGRRRVTP